MIVPRPFQKRLLLMLLVLSGFSKSAAILPNKLAQIVPSLSIDPLQVPAWYGGQKEGFAGDHCLELSSARQVSLVRPGHDDCPADFAWVLYLGH